MNDALLVIDVQNEYFTGSMPVTYPEGSLENIFKAMDRAHAVVRSLLFNIPSARVSGLRKGTESWELHKGSSSTCGFLIEKTCREVYRYCS